MIILLFFFYKKESYYAIKYITNDETLTTRMKAMYKGRKYLDQCLEEKLINNQRKLEISNNPKITMIIPVYNTGELIKKVLRSIQNQNMTDIEIILVNDYLKDNTTLNIIEKIKEEDPRIIIINNKKNMGILYSRCISVLQAKGEYIMNLDHDDFIFDEDVFDTSYNSAKKGNYDIVSFMYVTSNNYYCKAREFEPSDHHIPNNYIVLQPELQNFALFRNEIFSYFDYTIWAKLFKNNIYKKAVKVLSYDKYSVYNAYGEDIIGLYAISHVAFSYKHIRKLGVYHKDYLISTSHTTPNEKRVFSDIFFAEVIFDLGNTYNKKYSAIYLDNRVPLSNEENNKYLLRVLNKIMNYEYIDNKYKEILKNKYRELMIKYE